MIWGVVHTIFISRTLEALQDFVAEQWCIVSFYALILTEAPAHIEC